MTAFAHLRHIDKWRFAFNYEDGGGIEQIWTDVVGMSGVFPVIDDTRTVICVILTAETHDDAMHMSFQHCFAVPSECAISEIDADAILFDKRFPDGSHLFTLCNTVGRYQCCTDMTISAFPNFCKIALSFNRFFVSNRQKQLKRMLNRWDWWRRVIGLRLRKYKKVLTLS